MTAAPRLRLDPLLSALEDASELSEAQRIIEKLRTLFGVDHMVYHWVSTNGDQYGCGTYSDEWKKRYTEQEYQRTDPVVLGCFKQFNPMDWKELDWSGKAVRAFREEAYEYGVGNQGYSVPVRGPNGQFALFTVSHTCDDESWADFTSKNRSDLILLAHYFNKKALDFEPRRSPEPAQTLSPREVDALTFLAIGYSRAQVAEALDISQHTLRVYIESARFKLGAMNTVHAVAKALSRGLIVV